MKKHVKSVELSKWIIFARIVEQPIPFTGVVHKIMQISTMLRLTYNLLLNPSLMVEYVNSNLNLGHYSSAFCLSHIFTFLLL